MTELDTPDRRRAGVLVAVAGLALLVVLEAHLVGTVLTGVAVYLLMRGILRFFSAHLPPSWARAAALVSTLLLVGLAMFLLVDSLDARLGARGALVSLADLLANTLERLRAALPAWLGDKLPASVDDLQHSVAAGLRSHVQHLERWGQHLARGLAHAFIAVVVGVLAALERPLASSTPWMESARRRGHNFVAAFSDIVLAQLRISLANTALTAAFVLAGLPLAGIHLPFTGALVALTFFTGLIPIVGNLVSNAAILLVALTVSPAAAVAALVFLLVVHKLEYVLNAHFVGGRTSVPASALLASMVLLEAIFGIPGLVIAPIGCAWLFRELRDLSML